MLTAWSGGHAADAMLAEGPKMIDRALDSLATTFAVKRREIEPLLDSTSECAQLASKADW